MFGRLRYALDDAYADKDYGNEWLPCVILNRLPTRLQRLLGYPSRAWCRWRGHPAGVWWTNFCGLEPDMRCKGCGEDLG